MAGQSRWRRRGAISICALGAVMILGTQVSASGARPLEAKGETPSGEAYAQDGEKAVPEELRTADAPPVFDAWAMREALLADLPDGFAGVSGSVDGTHLEVRAVAGSEDAVSAAVERYLAQEPNAPAVKVIPATTSLARLLEIRDNMMKQPTTLKSGAQITSFGVRDSTNSVLIRMSDPTEEAAAELEALLGARAGELSIEKGEILPPAANRFDDSSPYNAGDRIRDENMINAYGAANSLCSSGFGVHGATTNTDYLVTAAHCSLVPGQAGYFWNGTNGDPRRNGVGFSQNMSFGNNGWDTQLIRAESSTITWTQTDTRSYIAADYTPVVNDLNKVINEGSTSIPWKSGAMNVVDADTCFVVGPYNVWGNVTICHLWQSYQPNTPTFCAGAPGDSGGPVVAYNPSFGPLAIGQNVAASCNYLQFHVLKDMLADNPYGLSGGLQINTVSDPG